MATYTETRNNRPTITGAGDDIIEGGDLNNNIIAGNGNNLVRTGKGSDLVIAGKGKDFINVGDGSNAVIAGGGGDFVVSGSGNDKIFLSRSNNLVSSGAGDDVIFATSGSNIINTGTGKDKLFLAKGNNRVILEGGGAVSIFGFDAKTDKLRLGEGLAGQSLEFVTKGSDTMVMAGGTLVATLQSVKSGSTALVDTEPLYRYEATDLGSLSTDPNGAVNAASINDFGQIAGRFNTGTTFANTSAAGVAQPTNAVRQGFIWANGKQTALTSTGVKKGSSDFGAANGANVTLLTPTVNTISDRGVVLGTADEVRQPIGLPTDRALAWQNNGGGYKLTINDFGGIESYFFDTNNRQQIAGRNIIKSGAFAFEIPIVFENGKVTKLADLGGDGGTARGINNQGQIVGLLDKDGVLDDKFVNTAAIWERDSKGNYQLKDLGTFGAEQAQLRDINDAGQIIGATSSGTGTTAVSNPFLLKDGKFTSLGSLGGKTGSVNAINAFGQVVGASAGADGKNRAYVWNNGMMTDLNTLIGKPLTYNGAAVTLANAVSINNFGDIVATGTYTYKDAAGKDATGTRSYELKGIANNKGNSNSPMLSLSADKVAKIVSGTTTPLLGGASTANTSAKTAKVGSGTISGTSLKPADANNVAQLLTTGGIADSSGNTNTQTLLGQVDTVFSNPQQFQQLYGTSSN